MNKTKLLIIFFFIGIVSATAQLDRYKKYEVKNGETIRSICLKNSITTYRFLRLNPDIKEGDTLEAGTFLIVPNKDYKPTTTSGEHVDYVKDGFLYHKLIPKETYYRLKKKYGVTKRQLRHYNNDLRFSGLNAGDVIKIPVKAGFELPENVQTIAALPVNTDTKPYLVKEKETKWKISSRYAITIAELDSLNPLIKTAGLKANEIILVPNKHELPDETADYVNYKVAKSEGLYRISKNFGVTQQQLIDANPELLNAVKEGMIIKIPLNVTESVVSTEVFVPAIKQGKVLNVVFMLPFMSNKNNFDFEKNRTSDVATDFYLGAVMALDSLKTQGLSVNVKVFDTENNKKRITSILSALDVSKVDVIIGPMFYNNVALVSKLIKGKNVPIISPVSRKDHNALGNNVVQQIPPVNDLATEVMSFVKKNYKGQNLVVIGDDKKESQVEINKTISMLNALDTLKSVTFIQPKKGYIKRDLFKRKLVKKDTNWVVLVTKDTIVTRDVINNLGSMPKEYKTTLFAMYKEGNFDTHNDINMALSNVNFHYPEHYFVDYESAVVKNFISHYKRENYAEPTEFSFKGFDVTYDALLRLASFDDFNNGLKAGRSDRAGTRYLYKRKNDVSGFINSGVYIVKYDGLNLVKVE